jgi:glycosyltransferase involved in cell wall biosynthesis
MTESLISVVCAVHNGERYVAEAIASVLGQRDVELELVVVDDGSSDGTPPILAEKAADPRVRVVTQVNRGVAAARNAGIAATRGDFVALIDADDVWRPDKLARQLALFRADPDLAIAFTGYAFTDEWLHTRGVVLHSDLRHWMLLEGDGPGLSSTAMVRVSALGDELRFHEELSTSADLEFAWRASRRGGVATVRAPLVLYRTHGSQMHRNFDIMERDVNAIYTIVFAGDDHARDQRRGRANMHTRIAIHALRAGRVNEARHRIGAVLRLAPSRLLLMPLGATRRRALRKLLRFAPLR